MLSNFSTERRMESKEVVTVKPRSARRRFSAQFKRELVEQALRSDVSLSAVALANGVNANQLTRWRRLYLREQAPGALVPVVVTEAAVPTPAPLAMVASAPTGEIEWCHGDTRLVVRGSVDATVLRTIISQTLAAARGA
jgi:transposase-like protein